jgi:hypothetical protein
LEVCIRSLIKLRKRSRHESRLLTPVHARMGGRGGEAGFECGFLSDFVHLPRGTIYVSTFLTTTRVIQQYFCLGIQFLGPFFVCDCTLQFRAGQFDDFGKILKIVRVRLVIILQPSTPRAELRTTVPPAPLWEAHFARSARLYLLKSPRVPTHGPRYPDRSSTGSSG